MTRYIWKGLFVDVYLLKKAVVARDSGRNDVIKTWSRRSTVMPQFVGLTFGVYNGKKFPEGHSKLPWEAVANKAERKVS